MGVHGLTFGSYFAGAMAHIPVYDFGPQSRVLAFGLCFQEIVSTLMAGGCLCVPTEDDRFGDIANVIQSMNVNMASFTPSFARQISPDSVPSLKRMSFVGEALPKDQRDTWADKLWLMKSYGPSECSVISTINPRVTKSTYPTNIGPLLTGSAWIVRPDDESRLVPIGATGELLIDGPLLGRGYLNDPAKTAASFIEASLLGVDSRNETRRLYKTGDLVRYDPTDGSIIYEGRKDMQVKIRGQRVEIGEIEHHLGKTFPKASGAAVELLKHANNTVTELVAFIFCDGMWDEASEHKPHQLLPLLADSNINNMVDIKPHLANVLPRHMIPSRFHLVPKCPMQPAGKLDRKKLRQELLEPTGYHFELERSDIEISLLSQDNEIALRLSEKIVKLVTVKDTGGAIDLSGRDLTLSTLGLDSIQLISLLTYIRKEYDVKLSIAILYNNNLTISGLAKIIDDYRSDVVPQHSEQTIDLSKQIQDLYDNFLAAPLIQNELASKTIFLTGATGYLGSQILRQLLTDTLIKKVIVHVRAVTSEEALGRVVHAASLGKWWSAAYLSRIECWPGDLRAHNLGLLPNQWSQLTRNCYPGEQINYIIHNGATVQWQAPYSALKAANVDSTLALLSAVRQWPSSGSFTYVSGGLKRTPDMDLDSFAASLQASNGYNQTKFVSEQLTARFASGNPKHNISIVRPGLIIGTEVEGIPNTDDFLWRLVQVCVSIGGYPAEKQDYWLSVTSVEEVATSIIDSTLSPGQQTSKVWDIDTGLVVGDFWTIVGEELGGRLKPMNGKEWIIAVKSFLENAGENHAFQPLMAMFQEPAFSLGSPASVSAKSDPSTFPALRKNLRTLLSTGYLWAEEQSKDSRFSHGLVPESGTLFSRSSIMKAGHGLLTKVVG